jgi:uncharacterized oxidoreductase
MSTGTIAAGKVRVARNKGSQLPEGALIDNQGRPSTDPESFFADPPGAITTAAGHKGYGLAVFVEILAGSLTAGGSSHPDNPTSNRAINNLLSILIDPARMAGGDAMAADIDRLVGWLKASPPSSPGGEVLLPGEIERRSRDERLAKGLPLDPNTLAQIRAAATSVGVPDDAIERGIVEV